MDPAILKGRELIAEAQKILVFSGAGLSTESGIPDFRSPGGLWDRYDPMDFTYDRILSDRSAREGYWRMSSEMWETLREAQPNRAHRAVKKLEDLRKLLGVVTQNIDGLHQKAGLAPEKVIEIHGSAHSVSCLRCGMRYGREAIHQRILDGERIPECDRCGGILKPDTISFGQAMPQDKMAEAFRLAEACDLCLVLGSSLVVYPAASVPARALQVGAKLMIVNLSETPLDGQANLVIHQPLTLALGEMVDED